MKRFPRRTNRTTSPGSATYTAVASSLRIRSARASRGGFGGEFFWGGGETHTTTSGGGGGVGELSPRFVNTTIRKIIHGEPLEFTSGTQNYDFVYIDDVARAFRLIGENGKPFRHYLIGSSNAKPLREFVLEMKAALAPHREFKFGNVPFTGVSLSLDDYDCSLTENDTGFKAEISFAEGVRRTMEWLREVEK